MLEVKGYWNNAVYTSLENPRADQCETSNMCDGSGKRNIPGDFGGPVTLTISCRGCRNCKR